jgi:hypothetical protein
VVVRLVAIARRVASHLRSPLLYLYSSPSLPRSPSPSLSLSLSLSTYLWRTQAEARARSRACTFSLSLARSLAPSPTDLPLARSTSTGVRSHSLSLSLSLSPSLARSLLLRRRLEERGELGTLSVRSRESCATNTSAAIREGESARSGKGSDGARLTGSSGIGRE